MTYTEAQLDALRRALATGKQRVTFGDKTVEYRAVEELRAAIREVEAALAKEQADTGAGTPLVRQIGVTMTKGICVARWAGSVPSVGSRKVGSVSTRIRSLRRCSWRFAPD